MIKNHLTSLILLLFSSFALSILIVPESTSALVVIPILVLLFVLIIIDENKKTIDRQIINRPLLVFMVMAFIIVLAFRFYKQFFTPLGDIKDIILVSLFNISDYVQVLLLVVVLAIMAIPYVCLLLHWLASMIVDRHNDEVRQEKTLSYIQPLIILLIAIVTITVFSKSSPLYPLNDWVDTNIFLTVGKSMIHGKVLYRDVYEQKGPLLFFIFMIPALISETSFIGLYFIEIIACFFFLLYSYKIMLLLNENTPIVLLPIYSFIIYCTASFCHGGSVEELCLPLLAISLYILTKSVLFNDCHLRILEAFINGIFVGCIFWIKYTMLGFYVGYALFVLFAYLKKHEYSNLIKIIGTVLGGIIVVSIPILAYFVIHNALPDLYEAYFYNNIFLYSAKSAGLAKNIVNGIVLSISKNLIVFGLIGIGLFALLINHRKLAFATLLCLSISLLLIITRHVYLYYPFILCVYAPFGFSSICQMLDRKFDFNKIQSIKHKVPLCVVVASLCFALFMRSSNRYLFLAKKEILPQYIFKDIVVQDEDQSLFCYGVLDLGLFTTTGTVPDTKYFCKFNVDLPEMYSEQQRYIDEAVVNYVVTMDTELSSTNYELVKIVDYYLGGAIHVCNLYHRVSK